VDAPDWARTQVTATGDAETVSSDPWATVWRLPVADGVVYVKECHGRWRFEPGLTAAVSARWPRVAVTVLAVDADRARLVLADAGDPVVELGNPPELWCEVLPRYAELQRGEAAHADAHLAAAVPDLRTTRLPAEYDWLLSLSLPITDDDRRRLAAFTPAFGRLCADLAATGTGDTVQHDDLHHRNVFRGRGGVRVLDWGDTSIAHPFFSAVVTFRFLEEHNGFAPGDPWFARVRDAYLEPWGRGRVDEFDLAQRVGIFAHAIAWAHCRAGLDPAQQAVFDRDYPVILRRALARVTR
jgi:hypothetical protein